MGKIKVLLQEIKIKYYKSRVKRLNKDIDFYNIMLSSNSTMVVDIPRYKQMKKDSESKLCDIHIKLYKLSDE